MGCDGCKGKGGGCGAQPTPKGRGVGAAPQRRGPNSSKRALVLPWLMAHRIGMARGWTRPPRGALRAAMPTQPGARQARGGSGRGANASTAGGPSENASEGPKWRNFNLSQAQSDEGPEQGSDWESPGGQEEGEIDGGGSTGEGDDTPCEPGGWVEIIQNCRYQYGECRCDILYEEYEYSEPYCEYTSLDWVYEYDISFPATQCVSGWV